MRSCTFPVIWILTRPDCSLPLSLGFRLHWSVTLQIDVIYRQLFRTDIHSLIRLSLILILLIFLILITNKFKPDGIHPAQTLPHLLHLHILNIISSEFHKLRLITSLLQKLQIHLLEARSHFLIIPLNITLHPPLFLMYFIQLTVNQMPHHQTLIAYSYHLLVVLHLPYGTFMTVKMCPICFFLKRCFFQWMTQTCTLTNIVLSQVRFHHLLWNIHRLMILLGVDRLLCFEVLSVSVERWQSIRYKLLSGCLVMRHIVNHIFLLFYRLRYLLLKTYIMINTVFIVFDWHWSLIHKIF